MAAGGEIGADGASVDHEWVGLELQGLHGHVAVCSCGWLSQAMASAGLAGGAADDHCAGSAPAEGRGLRSASG